jgi:hypothetical protein
MENGLLRAAVVVIGPMFWRNGAVEFGSCHMSEVPVYVPLEIFLWCLEMVE